MQMNHLILKLRVERDVIRLRNSTEDKRAFRRMLTSADRTKRRSQPPKRLLDEYVPVSNAKRKKKMVKDNRLYEVEIVAIDKQEKR